MALDFGLDCARRHGLAVSQSVLQHADCPVAVIPAAAIGG
jgi:nucleotide-binding universal stress UspA family protein